MGLLQRLYFNAVFGALGGLLGWLLFGIFGDKNSSSLGQQLLGGAFIGGFIGYFIVSVGAGMGTLSIHSLLSSGTVNVTH